VLRPSRALVFLVSAACSLALTLAAWGLARSDAETEARARFDLRAAETVLAIKGRMLDYEQVLRGAAGLFAASESVEAPEWAAYVRALRIEIAYPGIRGFGYAPLELAGGTTRTPVRYFEPLDERSRRSLGYDMYAEVLRRAAMERARDTAAAAITGALTLAQDAGTAAPPGFVMYLPVYRNGAAVETVAERRGALSGYVYAVFRYGDLVAGSVGPTPGVALRLVDATDEAAPFELYASSAGETRTSRYARADSFRAAQRVWRLESASLASIEASAVGGLPAVVLASGLAITALLMLVVWSLFTTRERARELAQHMTVALRASEERLQLALASSQLALFDWDVKSGLIQFSAEWAAMLGGAREPSLVPVQKLQMLVHPEDAPQVQEKVQALLQGQAASYRIEHRVRRQDGAWKWIESTARVNERDASGRAVRVTGANADIDERKEVERLKNEFIATVNHELRTPLTSILGTLGLLREGAGGALAPETRAFIDTAYANSERLADLVNDILDIERIEAGRVDLRVEAVPLGTMLAHAVELNAAYAQRYRTRFSLAPVAPGLGVQTDPDRLMQVLANLLSNAAKFSPPEASVTIAAGDAGGMVRIAVGDRGPGIPPEFRARLFGKFEQADRKRGGTGLGLAISKALVERMQGRIGCDSEPGRGSTFWVELPKA
jgi:PAS domain S-box-containing protein